jgi:N-acyl-D-aspartate/D-glutamate deacylase
MSGRNTADRTHAIRRPIGRLRLTAIGAAMVSPAAASSAQGAAEPVDIAIVNGVVIDGTGAQRRRAEVGISGDRIAYVGTRPAGTRPLRTIDARGVLVPGTFADVVVLDPARCGERASYTQPDTAPVGVSHVIVNGRLAVADGQPTGQQYGRGLVRPRQPAWACPAPAAAAVQHDD